MNTGIQDAYNLGWKLAHVLNDRVGQGLLDTYEEERLPIAAWTLNISSERHRTVMDAIKKGGDGGLHTIGTKDTTQLNLNYRYSSLSKNALVEAGDTDTGLQSGQRSPDFLLPDGRRLSDIYRGTHFTVLRSGANNKNPAPTNFSPEQVREYHLPENLSSLFGRKNAVYVVRPDGYIGLIADTADEAAVASYLRVYLPHEIAR